MSDPVQREWRFYIDDMIGFAETCFALQTRHRATPAGSRARHGSEKTYPN